MEIQRPSPNHSSRRGVSIDCIVIHDTVSRTAESALDWIGREESGVSYHVIVDRDGRIYRCVDDDQKAWHAGRSELWGRPNVNQYSLGVGLVDHDGEAHVDYSDEQLAALIDWCGGAAAKYRIPLNRIVGHEHIAPGRKIDPGPDFPWLDFLPRVAAWLR